MFVDYEEDVRYNNVRRGFLGSPVFLWVLGREREGLERGPPLSLFFYLLFLPLILLFLLGTVMFRVVSYNAYCSWSSARAHGIVEAFPSLHHPAPGLSLTRGYRMCPTASARGGGGIQRNACRRHTTAGLGSAANIP